MILQATCEVKNSEGRKLQWKDLTRGSKELVIELAMALQKDKAKTLQYGSIQFIIATHLHQSSLKVPITTKPWQQ